MRLLRIIGATLTLWALFVSPSFGDPITFIHQGVGNARLNERYLADAAFTITALGDTLNRQSSEAGFFIEHASASISIAGLGTFSFVTPTGTFLNEAQQVVVFSRPDPSGFALVVGPNNPSFATWDMLSPIGPVSGPGEIIQWDFGVLTSGGLLEFDEGGSPVVFAAITDAAPVPEPASLILVGLGLGAVSVARRLGPRNSL